MTRLVRCVGLKVEFAGEAELYGRAAEEMTLLLELLLVDEWL